MLNLFFNKLSQFVGKLRHTCPLSDYFPFWRFKNFVLIISKMRSLPETGLNGDRLCPALSFITLNISVCL
jgi:hypothetical protein